MSSGLFSQFSPNFTQPMPMMATLSFMLSILLCLLRQPGLPKRLTSPEVVVYLPPGAQLPECHLHFRADKVFGLHFGRQRDVCHAEEGPAATLEVHHGVDARPHVCRHIGLDDEEEHLCLLVRHPHRLEVVLGVAVGADALGWELYGAAGLALDAMHAVDVVTLPGNF